MADEKKICSSEAQQQTSGTANTTPRPETTTPARGPEEGAGTLTEPFDPESFGSPEIQAAWNAAWDRHLPRTNEAKHHFRGVFTCEFCHGPKAAPCHEVEEARANEARPGGGSRATTLPPDILGAQCGLRYKPRGDGGVLFQLMIEDDGQWHEKDFVMSTHWLPDLLKVVEQAVPRVDKAQPCDGYTCAVCNREQHGQAEVRWGPNRRFCSFTCARRGVVGGGASIEETNQRDHYKGLWDDVCRAIFELCDLAGATPEDMHDVWTLKKLVEELKAPRTETPQAEKSR